jgi:hypothetical protein
VIDECHRGSAADDSAWGDPYAFLGCDAGRPHRHATPKETEYVSNSDYFGEPVFTYSLKQGISDGCSLALLSWSDRLTFERRSSASDRVSPPDLLSLFSRLSPPDRGVCSGVT